MRPIGCLFDEIFFVSTFMYNCTPELRSRFHFEGHSIHICLLADTPTNVFYELFIDEISIQIINFLSDFLKRTD